MHYIFFICLSMTKRRETLQVVKMFANYTSGKVTIYRIYKELSLRESKKKISKTNYISQSEAQ